MVSAKSLVPNWLPRLVTPAGVDQASVLRGLRSDANGGVFAGYAGSFAGVWREYVTVAGDPDALAVGYSAAVATNYLYVLQQLTFTHDDTTGRRVIADLMSGGTAYRVIDANSLAQFDVASYPNELVLQAGEYLRFRFGWGATGSHLCATLLGYKVALQ